MADNPTALPRVRPATSPTDLAAARTLCWEYRDLLLAFGPAERLITQTFYPQAKFADTMARLAEIHARPKGALLLIETAHGIDGCGATQPLTGDAAEIKRVYLRPSLRGSGMGRALCRELIDQARRDGYALLFLDTSRSFTPARTLYESLGFVERGPYVDLPPDMIPALSFYELAL